MQIRNFSDIPERARHIYLCYTKDNAQDPWTLTAYTTQAEAQRATDTHNARLSRTRFILLQLSTDDLTIHGNELIFSEHQIIFKQASCDIRLAPRTTNIEHLFPRFSATLS